MDDNQNVININLPPQAGKRFISTLKTLKVKPAS